MLIAYYSPLSLKLLSGINAVNSVYSIKGFIVSEKSGKISKKFPQLITVIISLI